MDFEKSEQPIVLIVDDESPNLSVLSDYLKQSGVKPLIAEDGEEGLSQAEYAQPDIILLDIMMAGIDGFETCRRLKKNPATKDIPVIFMTALSDTSAKIRGFRLGAVDYITKPFQHEEVLVRIRTHLTLCQQEKKLLELNADLTKTNAAKDKFFSIIAHDLKGALSVLIAGCELLSGSVRDFDRNKIENFSKEIIASAKNTLRLLENLFDWARSQSGSMAFEPEFIELKRLAERNIQIFQGNANCKKIELSLSMKPDTYVYADRNMTNAIIRNLISNAIKFTRRGGEVSISAHSPPVSVWDEETEMADFVEVAVSDTGIGISEENIPKLLKIDNKYMEMGTEDEKGTGLGLILCKEFVEKNNGKIWIESELGKGTTFWFVLPASPSDI
ncbi:Two component system response regulator/histidine kinase [Desulfonema magnum]|uniref:histidine kinase n=2 Tax=Desulfonema magnum TaxID=45655 RepID=A0A975BXB1_9BACT|nr:Two component system response regulator/histidine kinase [Desulfonema magnum]